MFQTVGGRSCGSSLRLAEPYTCNAWHDPSVAKLAWILARETDHSAGKEQHRMLGGKEMMAAVPKEDQLGIFPLASQRTAQDFWMRKVQKS